jgi:hypothetical protein
MTSDKTANALDTPGFWRRFRIQAEGAAARAENELDKGVYVLLSVLAEMGEQDTLEAQKGVSDA